jgi:hypothetical protein
MALDFGALASLFAATKAVHSFPRAGRTGKNLTQRRKGETENRFLFSLWLQTLVFFVSLW